jgi:uncharacterized protein (DUF1330 family)
MQPIEKFIRKGGGKKLWRKGAMTANMGAMVVMAFPSGATDLLSTK